MIKPITTKIVNPEDKRGTFGYGTSAERKFQQQLRRDLLLMYNGRIAADRQNCLFPCVLHDRALEKGYFGLSDDYTLIVNHNKCLKHPVLKREIVKKEGERILLSQDKNLRPSVRYIRRHGIAHGIITNSSSNTQTYLA